MDNTSLFTPKRQAVGSNPAECATKRLDQQMIGALLFFKQKTSGLKAARM